MTETLEQTRDRIAKKLMEEIEKDMVRGCSSNYVDGFDLVLLRIKSVREELDAFLKSYLGIERKR